jgi:hypothetical protein
MRTATRNPQTGLTSKEAAATSQAVQQAPLEVLFDVAAESHVDLHGLSVEQPMTLTMGATGSRKSLEAFLRKLGKSFSVSEHRIAFDLIAKVTRAEFTLDFGRNAER